MRNEKWKPVPDYEGRYSVSSLGRVKRLSRKIHNGAPLAGDWATIKEKILSEDTIKLGYKRVYLYDYLGRRGLLVHRIVLLAFVGPCPVGCEARHINGIHNDNTAENLCWWTRQENVDDKKRLDCAGIKLKKADVIEIREWIARGSPNNVIADEFSISPTTVCDIKYGRTWVWL